MERALRALNARKAPGFDGIPTCLLVILKDEIVHCVHHIFTLSLTSGTLPTDWKSSTVTPIDVSTKLRTWKPTSGYQLPTNLITFECHFQSALGVISQKFAHCGQTKELSFGSLPPPPVLKRKCHRHWEKCMADGFNSPGLLQRSSLIDDSQRRSPNARYRPKVPVSNEILVLRLNLLKQCRLSHACRDASLEVQRPLQKEKGDNLKQLKKSTISTLFFSFSACSKADGRCRSTRCRTGASASAFSLAFKSAIDICRSTASRSACVHLPPWRSDNDPEHF